MILLNCFYAYLALGLGFGLWFVGPGGAKLDQQLATASWPTRLLLLPGLTALWPVLLLKLLKNRTP